MQNIFSKINPKILIHVIYRYGEGELGKMNFFVPDKACLQVAAGVYFPIGHAFSGPHRHLPQDRNIKKTQEMFVLISGSIEVEMYDLDDKLIAKEILNPGDCYVYLGGGHGIKILTNDVFFYELKNGPYYGKEKDKFFIKN